MNELQSANGHANGNGNGNGSVKALPLSLVSRLFNIAPSQWPRVTECWLFTFFFKLGSAIGWTVITAAFISRFGIIYLPVLFVLNAFLTMLSTYFFEDVITKIKKEVLMIIMVLIAALCLFFASFLYEQSSVSFFALVIFAESVFLAQFNVFIPILVGDRFTPLESQQTFPFVESADTIGGMIGGAVVGIFGAAFPLQWFLYIWMAFLACIIVVFIVTSFVRQSLPSLPFNRNKEDAHSKTTDQIKLIFQSIKRIPFLKGLITIVLLQWVFMNILEFQYTKAIQQTVTNRHEETIAYADSHSWEAALLRSPDGARSEEKTIEPTRTLRNLSKEEQAELTSKLGMLKGFFYAGALIVQILFASRLIETLGVVGSLLLHPVIMIISLVGMFLRFGFLSSVITRMNFEITNVVHKNAYFTSHYAFPKYVRDQAAEFLEGIVRPLGTIFGMLFIFGLQFVFAGKDLSMWIHAIMFVIMGAILINTMRLQTKYTSISKEQLFSDLPYPEKLNAIEILAQRGHKNAPFILVQKLTEEVSQALPREAPIVRIKLLNALGQLHDYSTLPQILESFYDQNVDVRLEAAHALMNFHDLGERFYMQAFSRYRTIETLKEIFRHEKSSAVRSAIIRIFSLLRQPDIVPFLLEVMRDRSGDATADCIYTIGLFHDPSAAYYIAPFLHDTNLDVRANAIIALWQFPQYRPQLSAVLHSMFDHTDQDVVRAGVYAAGEIGLPWQSRLRKIIVSADQKTVMEAAFALTKCADTMGFQTLLDQLLSIDRESFENARRFLHRLKPKAKLLVEQVLIHFISEELNEIMNTMKGTSLEQIDGATLEKLRRLYTLLEQHEELFEIEKALQEQKQETEILVKRSYLAS